MKTLQLKLRHGSEEWLNAAATEANQIWNYCKEVSVKAARPFYGRPKHLSAYELHKLLAGTSALLEHLPSMSIEKIATEYVTRRRQFKRSRLRWRVSAGSRRSLGWVPFRDNQCRFKDGAVVFAGRRFRVFDSYGLDKYEFRSGSFSQNALGEWFFNVAVREAEPSKQGLPAKAVGIDLGLRTIATVSDGSTLEAGRWTREIQDKLAQAQRRGHKRHAKRLHKKAANRRKDALHKFSRQLVNECGAIYIGDVSSSKLVKTKMAKSVLDSGWECCAPCSSTRAIRPGALWRRSARSSQRKPAPLAGPSRGRRGVQVLL
jgi:transposase